MSYLNRLSPEARAEVRSARKAQAQEDKARKLQRARDLLKAKEASFRKPRERDNEHLKYVRRGPCLPCLILGEEQTGPTRAMHVRSAYPEPGWPHTGMAQKPDDRRTLPGCDRHHTDGPKAQHRMNERTFWADLGIYPPNACAALVAARKDGASPVETVEQIAAEARKIAVEINRQHSGRRVNT